MSFRIQIWGIINIMVYGRLLFNNIKQYTPKWFKTIPYSQVAKPTFKKKPQVASWFGQNSGTRFLWKLLRNTAGKYAWSWSLLIFAISFGWYYSMYYPFIAIYKYNNDQRTYSVAYAKERQFKKKKEELEALEQSADAEVSEKVEATPEDFISEQHSVASSLTEAQKQELKKKKLLSLVSRIIKEHKQKKLIEEARARKSKQQSEEASESAQQTGQSQAQEEQ